MLAHTSMALLVMSVSLGGAFAHDASGDSAHGEGGHAHASVDVAADAAPRVVELTIEPDPVGGFNLFVATENFQFAPELVNREHVVGKGHGHIYVDGVKIARIYGAAYHLDGLAKGERQIEVTLNANDHREYSVDGTKVSAGKTLIVP